MTEQDILNENPWPLLLALVSIALLILVIRHLMRKLDQFEPKEVPPRKPLEREEPVEYFNDWAEHIAKQTRKSYYKGKGGKK
jgi:hypothetical protein